MGVGVFGVLVPQLGQYRPLFRLHDWTLNWERKGLRVMERCYGLLPPDLQLREVSPQQ